MQNIKLSTFFYVGKICEKITGIIGFPSGIIGFFLTIMYVIYNAYIFSNDNNQTDRLFENGAYMTLDGDLYIFKYTKEEYNNDPNIVYAKYKDLGKKQYNYNSDLYKKSQDIYSDFYNCGYFSKVGTYHSDFSNYNKNLGNFNYKFKDIARECQYLWEQKSNIEIEYKDSSNKYLYDSG